MDKVPRFHVGDKVCWERPVQVPYRSRYLYGTIKSFRKGSAIVVKNFTEKESQVLLKNLMKSESRNPKEF